MHNPELALSSAESLAASAALRETMVERQIRTFDVTDAGVLARMRAVPRELFIDPQLASLAYSDALVTVTGAKTRELTAPLILARLLKEAHLREGENVLVVAGGSGYAAALVAGLVGSVVSLDEDEALAAKARGHFAALGLSNAKSIAAPLAQGAPQDAPFDFILVDGVSQGAFETLLSQTRDGGRLIAIVAEQAGVRSGIATLFQRDDGHVSARPLFEASAGGLAAFAKPREFVF